jgi:predicted esterase
MWGALLSSDSDLNEAAAFFRDTSLVLVYGTRDQYAEEGMIPNYEKLLDSHAIPYRVVSFEGGHRMDRETLEGLAHGYIAT